MRKIAFYSLLTAILSSCSTTHSVVLHNNGNASIYSEAGDGNSFIHRLHNSDVILNIDSSPGERVRFDITSIDSIGNYLPHHQPGFLEFKNFGDSIVVLSGNKEPYANATNPGVHLTLRIQTDADLEAFDLTGKPIKFKTGRYNTGLWLCQTRRAQKKGKKRISAVLKRKN
jgi:hypothetical protein